MDLYGLQEEERPPFARRLYYTRPVWIIGMILIVLGAVGDFEALGYELACAACFMCGSFSSWINVFRVRCSALRLRRSWRLWAAAARCSRTSSSRTCGSDRSVIVHAIIVQQAWLAHSESLHVLSVATDPVQD